MNPFQSLRDYELFVYSLAENFPRILSSTLVIAQRANVFAELTGEIVFTDDIRLAVFERLQWPSGTVRIRAYGYEVWRGGEKLYWFDSQAHPTEPSLASTHPHHKHIPPHIKHHPIPAPGLSFDTPNLPFLIQEIEGLLR
jgi:hypothetical protein